MNLKKGDKIYVISGKDKGKSGTIEKAFPKENKVAVTGINMSKKHLKPSRKSPHGGIIDKIMPMEASNVMLVCPRCGKSTKVGHKITADKKIRICKKCNEGID